MDGYLWELVATANFHDIRCVVSPLRQSAEKGKNRKSVSIMEFKYGSYSATTELEFL